MYKFNKTLKKVKRIKAVQNRKYFKDTNVFIRYQQVLFTLIHIINKK